jgi:hypothetical protein
MGGNGSVEIFRTVHGSHLYGLDHADSDHDCFIVTLEDSGRVRHTVNSQWDTARVGWRTFLEHAQSGSHQSVEALFSPRKIYTREGERFRPLFDGMKITGRPVFEKYERTIHKFSHGDQKRRRHAVRLSLNLKGLRETGRFSPVLSREEKILVYGMAAEYEGEELWEMLR